MRIPTIRSIDALLDILREVRIKTSFTRNSKAISEFNEFADRFIEKYDNPALERKKEFVDLVKDWWKEESNGNNQIHP